MLPIFTAPLALYSLLALPVLAGIYLLHNRYRRQVVSSLLLWIDPHHPREGGPRINRLQTLLLFFLELVLLALLGVAAAGPFLPASQAARPLVVVLDDSFSMQAGEPDSPRAAALAALDAELRRSTRSSIRFVLAGERPLLLGPPVRSTAEAKRQLEQWRCQSSSAALDEALTLAAEVGGELAALLVLTDRAPAQPIRKGRVLWRAFGQSRANLAIVSAARSRRDGADRCVIAIENLTDNEKSTTLVVEAGDPPTVIDERDLTLKPGTPQPIVLTLKEGTGTVHARIGDDALALDNRVTLLPPPERNVRVQISLKDRALRTQTEKALLATREVKLVDQSPALLITDAATPPESRPEQWILHLIAGKENQAFDGPFVLERTHPLTEGLSLKGVIWAPGFSDDLPGTPLIMAGNTALMTDSEDAAGRHLIKLRMRHDLSTLLESPSWPVLLSNLLSWRASHLPGLSHNNVRLGEDVSLVVEGSERDVRVQRPDGGQERLPVQDGRVVVPARQLGLYELLHGEKKWHFVANAVNRDESDLRGTTTGTFGDWRDETGLRLDYRSIGFAVLLAALAVAAVHLLLVHRLGGRNR